MLYKLFQLQAYFSPIERITPPSYPQLLILSEITMNVLLLPSRIDSKIEEEEYWRFLGWKLFGSNCKNKTFFTLTAGNRDLFRGYQPHKSRAALDPRSQSAHFNLYMFSQLLHIQSR